MTLTSVEPDRAASSPAFPLITLACHVFSRSRFGRWYIRGIEETSSFTFDRLLAEVGGSDSNRIENNRLPLRVCMYTLTEEHLKARQRVQWRHIPACNIPSPVRPVKVPIFTRSPPGIRAKASISSAAVAMMGLAPIARVALADWVATTLLVICAGG